MADFEHQQLEIGLEFMPRSSDNRNNFSEGFSESMKDVQVIRVWVGTNPMSFLSRITCFCWKHN